MKKRVAAGIMAGIMAMGMLSGCGGGTKEADAEVKEILLKWLIML